MSKETAVTHLSAVELARRIREREVTPIDVVEAHIARIEAVNPRINAVVTSTFEAARHEAQQATKAIEQDQLLGPLHGVPFTAKDCLDVAGVRSTTGLTSRTDRYPDQDATVVARMRQAGAILLGKTNVPDNCWNQESDNLLFGRTNNPWDLGRTPGGSSGGEAAIIAAGGSPLGIGSDIAGSIRLPAHLTGIVGLRPTSSTLPETGNWPPADGRLADMEAIGPMARRVEDVLLAFEVLRGQKVAIDEVDLQGERVAFWFSDGLVPCSKAVVGGVQAAVNVLQQIGMESVEERPRAQLSNGLGWTAYFGDIERDAVARGFGDGIACQPFDELRHALVGTSRIAFGSLLYWLASHYSSIALHALGIDGIQWREELREQFFNLVGERGVAICPIFPVTALRHGWTKRILAPLTTIHYQAWVNLAGLPGLTVPVGRSGNGLPIGVQIVGAPGAERVILAAGLAIQRQLMPEWCGPTL